MWGQQIVDAATANRRSIKWWGPRESFPFRDGEPKYPEGRMVGSVGIPREEPGLYVNVVNGDAGIFYMYLTDDENGRPASQMATTADRAFRQDLLRQGQDSKSTREFLREMQSHFERQSPEEDQ